MNRTFLRWLPMALVLGLAPACDDDDVTNPTPSDYLDPTSPASVVENLMRSCSPLSRGSRSA